MGRFMNYLTDSSGDNVERPQDIKYMKVLRLSLRLLSSWPQKETGEKQSKYWKLEKLYYFLIEFFTLLPGLIYIRYSIGNLSFFELGHSYITVLMNIVAFSRLLLTFTQGYNKTSGTYVTDIHLVNHKHKSEYFMKIHKMIHKLSHFFTIYLNCMMVIGIILFNAAPLYKNIAAGAFSANRPANYSFEHSVYYALPFDYKTNLNGFFAVFSFNWYISYICSSCFCTFDLLISLMIFHVWGHLKVLIYNLENFSMLTFENKGKRETLDDSSTLFTSEEMFHVHNGMKENIIHYHLIQSFLSRMSNTFGPVLLIYYGFHQVSGCLLLLECSQMDPSALLRYGPLTIILFQQLIQISIIFELISSEAEKVNNAMYSVPWERMDTSNRKIFWVMLYQSQKPLNLKALDMVYIGVQTMASILKTSLTYFLLLRTIASEE